MKITEMKRLAESTIRSGFGSAAESKDRPFRDMLRFVSLLYEVI
jgi:hypothetical protein